ncbi:MAG: hypothetical protein Q7L55_08085 [Actinomycetota bacterium]|nr:hypothetical protein [Actinomycetota bacterium]
MPVNRLTIPFAGWIVHWILRHRRVEDFIDKGTKASADLLFGQRPRGTRHLANEGRV